MAPIGRLSPNPRDLEVLSLVATVVVVVVVDYDDDVGYDCYSLLLLLLPGCLLSSKSCTSYRTRNSQSRRFVPTTPRCTQPRALRSKSSRFATLLPPHYYYSK